ncbi:MAG: hypothetical protein C5B51_14510 [Terriglobia bacterium]|nr:MAG: hypothetical protein C5B51_14510 [Terriglobia bacterium]
MSKSFRLGVFVVMALAILAGAIFLIGDKQFLFRSTYRLYAEFPSVAGLIEGAEVRVGGLRTGTVKRIDLPDRAGGEVRVVMDLQEATRRIVRKDSVASISAEGLVGDKYVDISFGSDQAATVKDGDTIPSRPPVDVSDVVRKADALLNSANGAVESLTATADNLKAVSSKINEGKGTVGALINDRSIYQHVNQGAVAFQEDMEALKHNFFTRGFFKKRGYEDSAELTRHSIPALPSGPPARTFTYDPARIFEKPDSAKLKNEKTFKEAGELLEQNGFGLAVVAAYGGGKGDTEKQRALTQARAAVVRDYLADNFKFDDTKVKTLGLGKTDADASKLEILVYPRESRGSRGAASREK